MFDRAIDELYGVQNDLRRSGRHVFYDKDQSKLWVFRLSTAVTTDSAAPEHDGRIADTMRCHGLKSK